MRRVFERWFGQYPFAKVGYVATSKGAMEHQTMISLNTSLVQRRDTANMVAAHELAHQWWGDMVTPIHFGHAWLTESFATYCESLWTEDLQGFSAYLTSLDTRRSRYRSQIASNEGALPLVNFPRASPSSNYPETIYQKGAVILGMLRGWLGDSVFANGLRTYLATHRHGNASTDDLRRALEQSSGMDLSSFFDEWIMRPGWPRLAVTMRRTADGWTATFTQVQQQQQPTWPRYSTIPVAMTYREVGTNRTIDTVIVMGAEPFVLPTSDAGSVRVNAGMTSRSLVEVTTITSVSDIPTASITIAPNPASADVTLMTFAEHPSMTVTVVDLAGKTVMQKPWPEGSSTLSLAVHDLSPGAYVVRAGAISLPLVVE
jgi:aminopeptidase N